MIDRDRIKIGGYKERQGRIDKNSSSVMSFLNTFLSRQSKIGRVKKKKLTAAPSFECSILSYFRQRCLRYLRDSADAIFLYDTCLPHCFLSFLCTHFIYGIRDVLFLRCLVLPYLQNLYKPMKQFLSNFIVFLACID